ncbi:MAG: hypothetical protein ACRCXN_05620 [Bacteroidales bacterium]
MKAFKLLSLTAILSITTVVIAAEPKKGGEYNGNQDIILGEQMPDFGLKSLVPGKLEVALKLEKKAIVLNAISIPTGEVNVEVRRANGMTVYKETIVLQDSETMILPVYLRNGKHTISMTDGHTSLEGGFVVSNR